MLTERLIVSRSSVEDRRSECHVVEQEFFFPEFPAVAVDSVEDGDVLRDGKVPEHIGDVVAAETAVAGAAFGAGADGV